MSKLKNKIKHIEREQIYVVLLLLFVASFPITYNLNSRVLIGLAVFFFIDSKFNLKQKCSIVISNKLVLIMAIYFVVQLIGLLYTDDIKRGINSVTRTLPLLVLPMVIVSEKLNKSNTIKVLNFIKIWMLLVMIYFVGYQHFVEHRSISSTVHFAFEKLGISQHYVSLMLVVAIMISTHQLLYQSKKAVNTIIAIVLIAFLLLFSSRSSLIILIVSFMILFFYYFKNTNSILKGLFIFFGLIIGIGAFYGSPELQRKADTFMKSTDFDIEIIKTKNSITFAKNTVEQRIMINMASLEIIKRDPVFGVGTGDYIDELQVEYQKLSFIAGLKERFNAHNQYFEDYIKVGLLGFASCLTLIISLLVYGFKNKALLFYCAFGVAFMCLFESFFSRHHGTAFVAFFIPFFYKLEQILDAHTLK